MSNLKNSKERGTFHILKQREKLVVNPDNEEAKQMIDFYEESIKNLRSKEEDEEWKKNNLEYDLRSSEYIAEKCKNDVYAQNLYCALCNNSFAKIDVWEILKGSEWSCSWRYAGGIIADIKEEGDYIDFYCSGIRKSYDDGYVSESVVTDEIREDLLKIGWKVIEDKEVIE